MNRNQPRVPGSPGEGPLFGAVGNTAPAPTLIELFNAAVAHHQSGALAEAEHRYRYILALFPDHAETYSRLGAVLMAQGKTSEAVSQIERALALNPGLFEAYGNLSQAYLAAGQVKPAVEAAVRALELKETPASKALFVLCVRNVQFTSDNNGRFRELVLRALAEGWARPRELTGVCISLIKLDSSVNDGIAAAEAAWPARLSAAEVQSRMGELSRNELLRRLLECDPITDVGLERLLANLRNAMLLAATTDGACDESVLSFYCAVARQCFINEYVYSTDAAEADAAQRLRAAVETALASEQPCAALMVAAVGAYFPLHALPSAPALLERSWPGGVNALLVQQIKEPAEEQQIAATIPALTPIDSDVSRAVRQQYEENPYPRWVKTGLSAQPPSFHRPGQPLDVLIAGCGTGLSTVEFACQVPHARILAIDLSIASLSYAKRMVQVFGLANVEFGQADIVGLAAIGREFDFINATGVLHHLADPWDGWRVLLSLLRPGSMMQVALYSEGARRNIVAARSLIAARGYQPVPNDIRRCREDIIAASDPLLRSVTTLGDFFATSECRDLLFHVQEHRITLSEIKVFLAAANVQFAGFILSPLTLHKFAARFPDPAARNDLDCWHAFETEAPDTFAGMYQFWVRKPAASAAATAAFPH